MSSTIYSKAGTDAAIAALLSSSTFLETLQDQVAAMLVQGSNVTLAYNDATGQLVVSSSGGGGTLATLWAGLELVIQKDPVTGFWPASWDANGHPVYTGGSASAGVRPSNRTDLIFRWRGPDPGPAIVTSGTGGMLQGVDERSLVVLS